MSYPFVITITVTAGDIEYGVRESCSRCPVALATRRRFPGHSVSSGMIGVGIMKGPEWDDARAMWYECTRELLAFMDAFDNGDPVAPRSFTLRRKYKY